MYKRTGRISSAVESIRVVLNLAVVVARLCLEFGLSLWMNTLTAHG